MASKIQKKRIIELVREQLRRHFPGELDVNVSVVLEGVHQEDDWWYVPVQPDQDPGKVYPYYEVLANVEVELQDDHSLKVLLVPVLSEELEKPKTGATRSKGKGK